MEINFRQATFDDLNDLIRLFIDTITHINIRDYSDEQIQAWVTSDNREERWKTKIDEQFFLLSELDGKPTGFGSITTDGYLDLLYVHKEHQRKGIAQTLLNELLEFARNSSCGLVTTNASKTALPFFEKNHFYIVSERNFTRNGVHMTNYKMERNL